MDAHNATNEVGTRELKYERSVISRTLLSAGFHSRVRATINPAVCACVHNALRAVVNIVILETADAATLFLYHLLT